MIRQAGQVPRACAASIKLIPWPLNARRLALHSRHSRPLHTSPDDPPTAGPADSDPASNNTPPTSSPQQENHNGSGPGQPQQNQPAVNHAQEGPKTSRARPDRDHLGRVVRSKKWAYPDDRVRSFRRVLNKMMSKKKLDSRVAQFERWDKNMRIVFNRLNGVKTTPSTEDETEGMETLERLLTSDTVEDMRSSWLAIPPQDRDTDKWLDMMMAAVDSRIERTAMVLEATAEKGLTPSWAVADVFAALAVWYAKLPEGSQKDQQTQLPRLLVHLLRNSRRGYYRFHQYAIGLTLSGCEPDAVAEIYSAIQALDHPLHWNTKLKIAKSLTQKTKHKLAALRVFESLFDDPKADVHGRRCAALATELFALPEDWDYRRSPVEVQLLAEAFERVVGRGLSPNIVTYTAMIRALCLTNQLDAAWKIYEVMRNSGTTPDPHVFSILLNGAKRALRLDSVIRIMEEATPDALQTPYIWNDLVHTILLAADEELPAASIGKDTIPLPAFSTMLQVYSKFFDLKPLQKLIPAGSPEPADNATGWAWKEKLAPLIEQLPVSSPDKLVEPGLETLGIMLVGYIRNLPTTQHVMEFYSHFRKLLHDRDPLAIKLVMHNTLPYDVVLDFISTRPGMLNVALDIVQGMLRDAFSSTMALRQSLAESDPEEPGQSESPEPGTPAAYRHPAPSVHTWTILIRTFCWQAHPETAIRMIRIMRRHGVEPNHVTWHGLLNSYAKRQAVAPVMAVLDQLDKAGYQPNQHTIRAIAKLRGHEAILTRLDERAGLRDQQLWAEVEAAAAAPPPWSVAMSSKSRGFRRMRALRLRRQKEWESQASERGEAVEGLRQSEFRKTVSRETGSQERGERGKESRGGKSLDEDPLEEEFLEEESLEEESEGGLDAIGEVEAAEQAASDEKLDEYLRMYDELVFMRMGEEKDVFSQRFIEGGRTDYNLGPGGFYKPGRRTGPNTPHLGSPPLSGLGLHMGPTKAAATTDAADMPKGSG